MTVKQVVLEFYEMLLEGRNSTYTYFISAIATKLVLFTGIKNNALMFDFETGRKCGVAVAQCQEMINEMKEEIDLRAKNRKLECGLREIENYDYL